MNRFDFVTDPDDHLITSELDTLMGLLDNTNINENYLDRGLVRYVFDYHQDQKNYKLITEIIDLISYTPITVTMDLSLFNHYEQIGPVISSAEEIIKVLTSEIIKTDVVNVESVRYGNMITFTPITMVDGEKIAVYENSDYLGDYYRIVNMNYLGGYQVLSSDPIIKFITRDITNIKYIDNIALIPVGTNDTETNYFTGVVNEVSNMIDNKKRDGYFSYPISMYSLEDKQLIKELGALWDIEIVYETEDMMILKTTTDFGLDPVIWLDQNINLVKRGQFPIITLYGLWQFQLDGDHNEMYGKNWYGASLNYGAFLAYRKLAENDDLIRPFIQATRVNNDYSVTVSLPSYSHVINFKKYFTEIIDGYGIEYSDQSWFSEPCDGLVDGLIKRYYVQKHDNKAMSMIIPWTYDDGKVEQVLVFRSPLLAKYPNPFDFDKVNMIKVRDDLIWDLRNYYQRCHDQMEPVTLDQVNEMDLEGLLDLVEIDQDGKTYCLSKNTILNLTHQINPLTREPFSENIIIKAMLLEWGLRGLFDVGVIKGLYEDMPKRVLVKPKTGIVMITKMGMDPMLLSMLGDVYSVEVGFDDGTVSFLFDIATSHIDVLRPMIDKLWENGFFLSYWSSGVVKYSGMLTYSTIVSNPILLSGSETKSDGIRAMKYLQSIKN